MHIDERDLRELEQLARPQANLVDALETQGLEVIAGSGVIRP